MPAARSWVALGLMTLAAQIGARLAAEPATVRPVVAAKSEMVHFLRNHSEALTLSGPDGACNASLIETPGKRIFLLGQVHGVAINNAVDFALLRYLHQAIGFQVYVAEISYSHAWYLNRFLETGDPAILNFVFGQMHGFVDCSRETRHFWVELREWNESLPPAARIRIVGIDLERMPGISLAYLRRQLTGKPIPADLRPTVDRLRAVAANPSPGRIRALTVEMARSVDEHRADYVSFLGDRWFGFELALDNLRDSYRCRADKAHYDFLRDRVMYSNFCRQAAEAPFVSAYGRVGSDHVLQHRSEGIDHLSSLLNGAGSKWAGQVVGIWPLYESSSHLSFAHRHYGQVPCSDEPSVVAPFAEATSAPVTLFKLIGPHSPYARNRPLPVAADEGVTTDYFQYVVLIKRAGAATPLAAMAAPAPAG